MNTTIYLIDVDYLKENSVIDTNVEDKILDSSKMDAQNIDIQNIIGTALYNKIIEIVDNDDISGSTYAEYKILLVDHIMPTLMKYSLLRSIMPMRVKFRNKGLMEQNSDNAQPIDKEFINYVENKIRNDVEFYANKLKGYLVYFFNKYPEYNYNLPENRSDYNLPNKNNSYFCGIYLNKPNSNCNNR
jgi:hypothetical protein